MNTNHNKKKRLFAAIAAHEGLQEEYLKILKKLKQTADQKHIEIKWSKPENLHVTLIFLGETPEEQIPVIKEKIKAISQTYTSFQLKIDGLSGFPNVYSTRVIFMDVQRSQKILDLVSSLEQCLNLQDSEDYTPHLTIGRLRNTKSIKDLISPFVRKKFGKIHVKELILFESIPTGPFSIYRPLEKFPLLAPTIESEF